MPDEPWWQDPNPRSPAQPHPAPAPPNTPVQPAAVTPPFPVVPPAPYGAAPPSPYAPWTPLYPTAASAPAATPTYVPGLGWQQHPLRETLRRRTPPEALRPVIALLLLNLTLSIALTIAVYVKSDSIINYVLDHRHIDDPAIRATTRSIYAQALWPRVLGNLVASVVYAFVIRALLQGRRWAYRRVWFISMFGLVGLVVLLAYPYPVWMHAEQVLQGCVLAMLLYYVTRPQVRAHCQGV